MVKESMNYTPSLLSVTNLTPEENTARRYYTAPLSHHGIDVYSPDNLFIGLKPP